MRLKNVTGMSLDIPGIRVTVPAGGEFECPDDVAGEVPGGWRNPTIAEQLEGCRGLVTRTDDNGVRQVLSPGSGLLATGNYELVKSTRKKSVDVGKEGD